MRRFKVGEEVRCRGMVWVVSWRSDRAPFRYRLLASAPSGTRFALAEEEELAPMSRYLSAVDDTGRS